MHLLNPTKLKCREASKETAMENTIYDPYTVRPDFPWKYTEKRAAKLLSEIYILERDKGTVQSQIEWIFLKPTILQLHFFIVRFL